MPTKLGDFINDLALKAGVAQDSPELKAFLSTCQIVDVDDNIVSVINKNLMTKDAALNNPEVINALVTKGRAEAFNKIDATYSEKIFNLLDPEDQAAIKDLKYTNDKVAALEGVISKYKQGKKGADAGDKAAFQKEIDKLQADLKAEKEARSKFEQDTKTKYENDSIENALKYSLFGKNWKLPTDTEQDKQFAVDTAALKVKQGLANKGYKLVQENGKLELRNAENGSKVYDPTNNTEVLVHNFINGEISQLIAPVKVETQGKKLPDSGGNGSGQNVTGKGVQGALEAFDALNTNFASAN